MKYYITLFFCLVSIQQMSAQSITFFNIDTTYFPVMKAKFYAFDADGVQQRPDITELTITESKKPRVITSVNCPAAEPPKTLSTVLVIDISGSMSTITNSVKHMDMAKVAAQSWVNNLPLGNGECAVTSFDDDNYLNQDFTTDTSLLNQSIRELEPNSGTDYNAALITPMAGGLQISKNGKNKRVIIMLTDGQGGGSQKNNIIAEANRQECSIYCVTISMNAPAILKEIAYKTGGQVYENVQNLQEIEQIYHSILHVAQTGSSCQISWISEPRCSPSITPVELTWKNLTSVDTYTPPSKAVSSIAIQPSSIFFKNKQLNTSWDTTITLTAKNDTMTVTDIVSNDISAVFSTVNTNFPLVIPQNTSKTITLRFTPTDSSMKYAKFYVLAEECMYPFSASGGLLTKKITSPTLRLTHPLGGETFLIGSDTVISWDGIGHSDTVSLEYSTDSGKVWRNITQKTTGLLYNWKGIPAPPSTKCLLRVSQLQEYDSVDLTPALVIKHSQSVACVAFAPDDLLIATASDTIATIWDAETSVQIKKFKGHTDVITSLVFSQDGNFIITGSADKTAKVWDVGSGALLFTISGHQDKIYDVAYSINGNFIATASGDGSAKLWDWKTGNLLKTLVGHIGIVYGVAINYDGNQIATVGSDKTIKIWNAYDGQLTKTLTGHKGYVYSVAYSPDGSKIGTTSNDNSAKIWDVNTGVVLKSLEHANLVSDIAFSSDGKRVATASKDYYTKIWDVNSGAVLRYLGGTSAYSEKVCFSADGKRVLAGINGNDAAVWDEPSPIQTDITDSVFSIVAPQPSATDVAMGLCAVGKNKDSTIVPFVWNTGSYPFQVNSIAIIGQDAAQFTLISGIPPVNLAPGDSHAVEFSFRPTSPGVKTAQLIIYTQSDTLKRRITGEGIISAISVVGKLIDFGKVLINTYKDTLQTVTIRNTSSTPVTIKSTRHAGPNTKDYSTLSGGGTFTIPPGEFAKLDLRFYPKNTGRTSGRILFEYDGIDSPITVQLFGEGVKPGAQILSSGITIPPVICTTESTDTLRISNRGTDTLKIASAVFSGSNYQDFQFSTPFAPVTVLPDSMLLLPLNFTPSSAGTKSAMLELHSNSLVDSILKVPLAGERQIVAFTTNIQKIDLGTICPNEARDTSITLTNTGSIRSTFMVQSPGIRAELIDTTLNSSGSTPITLHYPGRAGEGLIDEIITITDTLCGKQTTVQVIGTIQLPQLSYPPFFDFGAVANGASSTLDIIAVNKDARSIVIAPPQGITPPFSIISLAPPAGNVLAPGDTLKVRVQYSATGSLPNAQMIRWNTITPCATLDSTELRVSGITHTLASVATITFDSVCVGQSRQLKAQLSNTGSTPLQLLHAEWITNTGSLFSTTVTPAKILAPGTTDSLDITFTPSASGLVNADLRWVADLDTAFTTVSGIGKVCATNLDTARTMIIAPNITAKAGEKVNLTLKLWKPTGMEIVGAPTDWQARIHYNKSILFTENSSDVCTGTTDSCVLELTGVYNPKSEELISIPCITTLGNTDHSTIVIDTFYWKNSAIVTEVATQNGLITLNGVCEDGGVRLFIPAKNSTSLSTRPNPAQDNLQIQYGLREPLTVSLELLTMTGQVAQTILNNQAQVAGQYTLTSDLSILGNGVYLLRLRTNKEMLTTRVDVVK